MASQAEGRGPVVATQPGSAEAPRRSAWPRALGLTAGVVALAAIGGFWWRRSRSRRVEEELSPLSQEWLAEHYYQAGQRGDDE